MKQSQCFQGQLFFIFKIIRLFQINFLINKAKKGTKNKILRINLEDIFMTIKKGVVILTQFSKRNITDMLRKMLNDDWEHKICQTWLYDLKAFLDKLIFQSNVTILRYRLSHYVYYLEGIICSNNLLFYIMLYPKPIIYYKL